MSNVRRHIKYVGRPALKSLSDCDSDYDEENESLWYQHVLEVDNILSKLGLANCIQVADHRHCPFLVELLITDPRDVTRTKAEKLSRQLRQYLRRVKSDWRIHALLIPVDSPDLQDGIWLEIDRFWIVERFAKHSTESHEVLEEFVSAYWKRPK